jgi:hypothetical protein
MTAPSNPPPPPGPGREASPLTAEQRADNYRRQTGARDLTPRQRRRAVHKANKAKGWAA